MPDPETGSLQHISVFTPRQKMNRNSRAAPIESHFPNLRFGGEPLGYRTQHVDQGELFLTLEPIKKSTSQHVIPTPAPGASHRGAGDAMECQQSKVFFGDVWGLQFWGVPVRRFCQGSVCSVCVCVCVLAHTRARKAKTAYRLVSPSRYRHTTFKIQTHL